MFTDRLRSPQSLLIEELRQQLTLPYSSSRMNSIRSNYDKLYEMLIEKIEEKLSENKEPDENAKKQITQTKQAYRHLLIHFHNDIVNKVLSHLCKNKNDEEAIGYLKEAIELNLTLVSCKNNCIEKLHNNLLAGLKDFPPSLDFYQNADFYQPEKKENPSFWNNLTTWLQAKAPTKTKETGEKEVLREKTAPNYGSIRIND